jgi:hypothetical protein
MSCSELVPQTGGDPTDNVIIKVYIEASEEFMPAHNNKSRRKLQAETIHTEGSDVFVIRPHFFMTKRTTQKSRERMVAVGKLTASVAYNKIGSALVRSW